MIKTSIIGAVILLSQFAYSQDLRSFQQNSLFGFKKGDQIVIPASYQYASEFYGKYALVKSNGLWGYIDKSNQIVVTPQFDRAELMIDGFARVYKNDKIGLFDSTGKTIVPIEFDRFEDGYYGLMLIKGTSQGLLTGDGTYIQPKYTKITKSNKFIVGTNGQKHDIYYDGKLLFEGSQTYPELLRYYSSELVDVYKDGKAAILSNEGKFLTEFLYSTVKTFTTSAYPASQADLQYNYMIALDRSYVTTPENGDPDLSVAVTAYDILRADGKMLSDKPFDQVFTNNYINMYDENEVKLKQNGHFATIDPEGNLNVSPYTDITYYQNIQIRYKDGKQADICTYDEPSQVIRSFNFLEIPQYTQIYYDEETGEMFESTNNSMYGEVIVSDDPGATTDVGKKALYDVVYRQFMTKHTDTLPTVTACSYFGDSKYYVLLKDGYFNIWFEGQLPIKDYPYESIEQLGGEYFLVRDSDGHSGIMNLKTGTETPIGTTTAEFSEGMYTSFLEEQNYNPEEYYSEPVQRFHGKFVHLSDTSTGKVGFLWNDVYFTPQFDSLMQDPSEYNLNILHLRKGNKWGSYHLNSNSYVEPYYDSIALYIELEGYSSLPYSDFSEKGGYYMDVKGRKWPFLPYDVYPDGRKNKLGLMAYDVFSEEEKPVYITSPVFRDIESTEIDLSFIAQNKKKKYGILNPYGDTLLPIEYTSIQYADLYSFEGTVLFNLKQGKKWGVYQSGSRKVIPAIYDKVEPMFTQMELPFGYLVHLGDFVGLYDMEFNLLLPCEYNGIALNYSNEVGYQLFVLKGEKMTVINSYNLGYNLRERVEANQWYDRIAGQYGYILKNGKWETYNYTTYEFLGTNDSPADFVYDEYSLIFFENGLIGIKDTEGLVLNPPRMKFLIFMSSDTFYTFKEGDIFLSFIGSEDSYLRSQY